jgi:apolipoprotein N-acyltransferase
MTAVDEDPMASPAPGDESQPAAQPGKTAAPVPTAGRPIGTLPAVALALVAGFALLLAFPSYNQWWAAPVGVAALAVATHRRGLWSGFRLGGLAGLALYVPMLWWTHIVGGALPWLLLAVLQAAYLGLLGAASAYTSPLVDRFRWSWPLVAGSLWVAQEALRDRTPFGGFPWGRLAFSQSDSPVLRYAVVGGAPLVTFVTAAVGGLLALAALRYRAPRTVAVSIGGAAVLVLLGLAVPTSAPTGRPVRVAIVQGNVPRLGLEFNAQRRAVLDNHVNATLALAARVAAGKQPRPDIVVWPENSSDIDPLVADDPLDSDAAAEISYAADMIGAPILVGAVLEGPGTHARNAAIVWLPTAGPQSGPHGMYVKLHPVPFAEYVPLRSVARMVTDKVDLVRSDFLPGTTPGVLTMGSVTVGDAICFEVAYDNIVRNTVTGGAQLLTVQTNNADFNPAEAAQQMAMVRLRAVEAGRDAMMVSTVGISGFVDASGGVHDKTGFNVPATEVRTLRLGNQRTLATELGEFPEFVITGLAVVAIAFAIRLRFRLASGTASPVPANEES